MKKILFFTLTALCVLFTGCGGSGNGETPYTPPVQEELSQNAYADNENTGGGFSFSANKPWSASISETATQAGRAATRAAGSANEVVWLKLYNGTIETYSGAAGDFSLTVVLDQNYTGEDRSATIVITVGGQKFTITVIQKGTKQDDSANPAPVPVESITLNKEELSLEMGETETLTASVLPSNATIKSVKWSSSNPSVATVDPVTGLVTAIATNGTAIITATSSSAPSVSGSCVVTVGDSEDVSSPKKRVHLITITTDDPNDSCSESPITIRFYYDKQDRIVGYTNINFDGPGTMRVATFDYGSDKITVDYVYTNENGPGTGQTIYNLNAAGNAVSMLSKFKQDDETDDWESSATFTYDVNGYLTKSVELYEAAWESAPEFGSDEGCLTGISTGKRVYACTWSGDNIANVLMHDYSDVENENWDNIEVQQCTYGTTAFPDAAYMVLGMNMSVGGVDEPLPIFGNRSANLPLEYKTYGDAVGNVIDYDKPSNKSTYAYTWDGDDLVKITEAITGYNSDGEPETYTTTYVFNE